MDWLLAGSDVADANAFIFPIRIATVIVIDAKKGDEGDLMNMKFRGQGATEYLVLLGAVLIVALVALALLGYFPGLATDAKLTQSQAYWTSEAKPFAINEIAVSSGGNVQIVLQNKEATGAYSLNALTLGGVALNASADAGSKFPVVFAPGDTQKLSFTNTGLNGTASKAYEYSVVIDFTSPANLTSKQFGGKPVMGKYA